MQCFATNTTPVAPILKSNNPLTYNSELYPQNGTKPPAFTHSISNWNPQLKFYNRNGNTYIDKVSVDARNEVYVYTYDSLNRLTNVNKLDGSTVAYTYDALGNRMEKKVNGNTQYTYEYTSANELDHVKNPDGSTYIDFDYDANGNTLTETQTADNQQQSTSFTYDNKNLLVKVVKPSGDIIEYVYDGNGNRYSKSINGETRYYHYDTGGNIISETDESGGLLVKYVRDTDGQAISMIQGSNSYYFLYNAHGDVTSVTDSSGNVVASYAYDEFGNLNSNMGNIYNPLRYSGANWTAPLEPE